jgi:hypothetical protein
VALPSWGNCTVGVQYLVGAGRPRSCTYLNGVGVPFRCRCAFKYFTGMILYRFVTYRSAAYRFVTVYRFVTCTILLHVPFYYMYRFVTASSGNEPFCTTYCFEFCIVCKLYPFIIALPLCNVPLCNVPYVKVSLYNAPFYHVPFCNCTVLWRTVMYQRRTVEEEI